MKIMAPFFNFKEINGKNWPTFYLERKLSRKRTRSKFMESDTAVFGTLFKVHSSATMRLLLFICSLLALSFAHLPFLRESQDVVPSSHPSIVSGVLSFWWADVGYFDQMTAFWSTSETIIDKDNWQFTTWTRELIHPSTPFQFTWNSTRGNFNLIFPTGFCVSSPAHQHNITLEKWHRHSYIVVRFQGTEPAYNKYHQNLFFTNRTEIWILP